MPPSFPCVCVCVCVVYVCLCLCLFVSASFFSGDALSPTSLERPKTGNASQILVFQNVAMRTIVKRAESQQDDDVAMNTMLNRSPLTSPTRKNSAEESIESIIQQFQKEEERFSPSRPAGENSKIVAYVDGVASEERRISRSSVQSLVEV